MTALAHAPAPAVTRSSALRMPPAWILVATVTIVLVAALVAAVGLVDWSSAVSPAVPGGPDLAMTLA